MGSLKAIALRTGLLLAIVISSSGCLAPVLHQTQIADFGHGSVSVAGQLFMAGVQGSVQAALGILPHVQLEGAAAVDVYGDRSEAAGLRGEIPLGRGISLQIAALYQHQFFSPENYSTGDDTYNCVQAYGCTHPTLTDTGEPEAGVVGHVGSGPRAPSWGLWIREGIGTQTGASGPPTSAEYDQLTASGSLEIPLDDARVWNLLAGLTARVARPFANGSVAIPSTAGGGAGIVMRF